ncbi:MAG: HEWD family protein [Halobacterium sp.]
MSVQIRKPTERVCERCARAEVWDEDACAWKIAHDEEGDRQAGNVYCIHEWDINGDFVPFEGR